MADCGALEYVRGGMIAEAYVTATSITESRISSSIIRSSEIQKLSAIDEASAQVIAQALSQLPESALAELAKAIMGALQISAATDAPTASLDESLPASVIGARNVLLGEPATWIPFKEFVVPGYKAD